MQPTRSSENNNYYKIDITSFAQSVMKSQSQIDTTERSNAHPFSTTATSRLESKAQRVANTEKLERLRALNADMG